MGIVLIAIAIAMVVIRVTDDDEEGPGSSAVESALPHVLVNQDMSAPAPAREARHVRRAAVKAIQARYTKAAVRPGLTRNIGGVKFEGADINATAPKGKGRLSIIVAAGAGKQLTYLTEIFANPAVDPNALRGAQLILDNIEFTK